MSIQAMKHVVELYDEYCYNNDYGGIEFNERHAYKFIEAIEALRTALQRAAESEPVAVAVPHIAMGFGRYEVGSGTYQGTPCIAFGKNGTGKVGDFVNMEPRQMSAEETVAVITFANVEGLDVLQEKVDEVRALHFPDTHPDPGVPDGWRIEEKGGELIVQKNGFGGYSARKNTESIAEAVLHELALDLLAAAPAQKG